MIVHPIIYSIFLCVTTAFWSDVSAKYSMYDSIRARTYSSDYQETWMHKGGRWSGEVLIDAMKLNLNLFSVTSAKILTGVIPFYLASRMIDENVQCTFYDRDHHKNIRQMPSYCYSVAKVGVGVPMIGVAALLLLTSSEEVRQTARMCLIGLPMVHWGKDLIKNVKAKACLRPWNENFSCKKRASGGFPSGHMANITFITTLFAMRHGPKFGIPLGIFGGFVFANFLSCNRHYVSQLVAGIGLGLFYAFAADKVINERLGRDISCNVCIDSGAIGLKATFNF